MSMSYKKRIYADVIVIIIEIIFCNQVVYTCTTIYCTKRLVLNDLFMISVFSTINERSS